MAIVKTWSLELIDPNMGHSCDLEDLQRGKPSILTSSFRVLHSLSFELYEKDSITSLTIPVYIYCPPHFGTLKIALGVCNNVLISFGSSVCPSGPLNIPNNSLSFSLAQLLVAFHFEIRYKKLFEVFVSGSSHWTSSWISASSESFELEVKPSKKFSSKSDSSFKPETGLQFVRSKLWTLSTMFSLLQLLCSTAFFFDDFHFYPYLLLTFIKVLQLILAFSRQS